jgi:hypothetical protein
MKPIFSCSMYVISPSHIYSAFASFTSLHRFHFSVLVSYFYCGEANGQFLTDRCAMCKRDRQKCPQSSAIIHPSVIFILDAPQENLVAPVENHVAPVENLVAPVENLVAPTQFIADPDMSVVPLHDISSMQFRYPGIVTGEYDSTMNEIDSLFLTDFANGYSPVTSVLESNSWWFQNLDQNNY